MKRNMKRDDSEAESMTKKELALRYAPNLSASGAANRLRRWINGDQHLLQALEKTGYNPRNRVLTKEQAAIILEHLG